MTLLLAVLVAFAMYFCIVEFMSFSSASSRAPIAAHMLRLFVVPVRWGVGGGGV